MSDDNIPAGLLKTPAGIYVLKEDSHLSRWVEADGRLDHARGEIEHFKPYIPKGGIVIDAGASLGDHTITYAELVGEKGVVFAFEPNPLPFLALRKNMEKFCQVSALNFALSDREGVARMQLNLCAGMAHITDREDGTEACKCVTLDEQLGHLPRLDFIHLDVEGYEAKAIIGGRLLITNFRPVIVIEVNKMCLDRIGATEDELRFLCADMNYTWNELAPHHGSHMTQRDVIWHPKK
jgi:FkbM family methyltransferase